MRTKALCLTLLAATVTSPAFAGDVARGQDAFLTYCDECHRVEPNAGSRKAPNLFGIVGRLAGTVPGFDYSDANRTLGFAWTPDKLETYLAAPRQVVPATTMKFKGVSSAQDRQDLVAYLSSLK